MPFGDRDRTQFRLTSCCSHPLRLDSLTYRCFHSAMGRLLDSLLEGSHAYRIERETVGYSLVAEPDCLDEFRILFAMLQPQQAKTSCCFP